jgi:hypothetical protein
MMFMSNIVISRHAKYYFNITLILQSCETTYNEQMWGIMYDFHSVEKFNITFTNFSHALLANPHQMA